MEAGADWWAQPTWTGIPGPSASRICPFPKGSWGDTASGLQLPPLRGCAPTARPLADLIRSLGLSSAPHGEGQVRPRPLCEELRLPQMLRAWAGDLVWPLRWPQP